VSDLNKNISDVNAMRKKMLKDLQGYLALYTELEKDVQNRFQTEYRHNNNNIAGLEDFQRLSYICKKNLTMVKSATGFISKVSDLSGFDINEEDALVRELDKILKD